MTFRLACLELVATSVFMICTTSATGQPQQPDQRPGPAPGEAAAGAPVFNVRTFGAMGDGDAPGYRRHSGGDRPVQRAVEAARCWCPPAST